MSIRAGYRRNDKEVKALLAWVNNLVKPFGLDVSEIDHDFADGVILINMLKASFDGSVCETYNSVPKLSIHKLDNLQVALNFLESKNIQFVSLDRQQIIAGDEKQTVALLSNILRQVTVTSMNPSYHSTSGKDNVKGMILDWINETVKGPQGQVKDLSNSLKDGTILCNLVSSLSLDGMDSVPDTPLDRIQAFFDAAEKNFGIPTLMTAEEFITSTKDSPLMENYFCMLISSFNALHKGKDAAKERDAKARQLEAEKERELVLLKQRLEEDNQKLSTMEQNVEQIKLQYATQLSEAEKIAEQEQQKHITLGKQLEQLQESFSQSFQQMQSDLESEKLENLRLKDTIALVQMKLEAAEAENVKSSAELYNVYKDYEHLVSNFRREIKDQVSLQHAGEIRERTEQFSTMAEQSHAFSKGFVDSLKARGVLCGWFSMISHKKRMFRGVVQKQKRVWVVLKGPLLFWSKEIDARPQVISLEEYHIENIDQLVSCFEYSEIRDEKCVDDILEIPEMVLSPNDKDIGPSFSLSRISSMDKEVYVDFYAWVGEIHTRVSLISYFKQLEAMDRTEGGIGGCREVIAFMSHPSLTEFRIENTVPLDFLNALQHFKAALTCRRDFNVYLNNIGLKNNAAKIVCEIVSKNKSIRQWEMKNNFITANCALDIKYALESNGNLERVHFGWNQLKDLGMEVIFKKFVSKGSSLSMLSFQNNEISDEGVDWLAAAIEDIKGFQVLELDGNSISDTGCESISLLCARNASIDTVRLNRNLISDKGATALAQCLCEGSGIRDLGLAKNQISYRGAVALAKAVSTLESAMVLDLSFNKLIGKKGYAEFFNSPKPIDFDLFRLYINSSSSSYLEDVNSANPSRRHIVGMEGERVEMQSFHK